MTLNNLMVKFQQCHSFFIHSFLSFFLSFCLSFFFSFFLCLSLPWSCRLGLQNTPTAHLHRGKAPTTSALYMTRNNLMVKFQQCHSFFIHPFLSFFLWLSLSWSCRLRLKNTPTAHLHGGKTLPTSVLYMTLNNLMVKFQQCHSFGMQSTPSWASLQVHTGLEW